MTGFMQATISRSLKPIGGLLSLLTLGLVGVAAADEGRDRVTGPHGGAVARAQRHQFEVVFRKDGLAVYPYGPDGKPVAAAALSGTATFYHPGSPQPWFSRPLRAAGAVPLGLDIGLSRVPASGAKVTFEVAGLPDPAETAATFTVPFTVPSTVGGAPVVTTVTFARATAADQKAIAAQKVCRVSREPLGSMGAPIKATRGDRSVFLCCASCEKQVLADPGKFFGAR